MNLKKLVKLNIKFKPYLRKTLYLIINIPMIVIYVLIALLLSKVNTTAMIIYLTCFVVVAFTQAYVCAYWQCSYVGKFAPCVGGFCLPSSRIALLFRNVKKTKTLYTTIALIAFAAFLGIFLLPVYFIYLYNMMFFILYLIVLLVYGTLFLWHICPVCCTNKVCPGGKIAMKMKK